jgi:hypothetical protein
MKLTLMNLSVYLIAGVFSDMELNINEPVSVFDCRCFSDMKLTLMNLSVYLIAGDFQIWYLH